jgi:hypothetical protein
MTRNAKDTTSVYRFKATHSGVSDLSAYGRIEGLPFEDVHFIGPYTNKVAWNGWVPSYGDLKVERQQLVADAEQLEDGTLLPFLDWVTIETKYYKDGEPVL